MKKTNQTKAYSNNHDYLNELRRNNMLGVNYYNDINEFASENEAYGNDYFKEEPQKKDTSKKCDCNNPKEPKPKKSKK